MNTILRDLVYAPDAKPYLLTSDQENKLMANGWDSIWNFEDSCFLESGAELVPDDETYLVNL